MSQLCVQIEIYKFENIYITAYEKFSEACDAIPDSYSEFVPRDHRNSTK